MVGVAVMHLATWPLSKAPGVGLIRGRLTMTLTVHGKHSPEHAEQPPQLFDHWHLVFHSCSLSAHHSLQTAAIAKEVRVLLLAALQKRVVVVLPLHLTTLFPARESHSTWRRSSGFDDSSWGIFRAGYRCDGVL